MVPAISGLKSWTLKLAFQAELFFWVIFSLHNRGRASCLCWKQPFSKSCRRIWHPRKEPFHRKSKLSVEILRCWLQLKKSTFSRRLDDWVLLFIEFHCVWKESNGLNGIFMGVDNFSWENFSWNGWNVVKFWDNWNHSRVNLNWTRVFMSSMVWFFTESKAVFRSVIQIP